MQHFIIACMLAITVFPVYGDVKGFDINDPKTNLNSFMKTIKSTFYNETCISLFNGTIYSRKSGQTLLKMFYFDGFVIGRNIQQKDGSYLDLNRVFGVFRDLKTSEILRVFINPMTKSANEVFFMANNPVDYHRIIGPVVPTLMIPGNRIVFNVDNIHMDPNPLDPATYPKYSAGKVFDEVEFAAYFTDYLQLQDQGYTRTPFVGTRQRRSQYLPWMEMGNKDGSLFFNGMIWKCYDSGLSCIPVDIWDQLSGEYDVYTTAPFNFEYPNDNEWTTFKSKIDGRRASGDPDIIIPEVDIIPHPIERSLSIDPRVENALITPEFVKVHFNGSVLTEIIGQVPKHLFNIEGLVQFSMKRTNENSFSVIMNITGEFRDYKTGVGLNYWKNTITNKTVRVPRINEQLANRIERDQMYTINMTGVNYQWNSIGLLLTNSTSNSFLGTSGLEQWSVIMIGAAFVDNELNSQSNPNFVGSFITFSSWFNWMMMDEEPGTLLLKATFFRTT